MALRKIFDVEGKAVLNTPSGNISLGQQKVTFSAYCKIGRIEGGKESAQVVVDCQGDNQRIVKQYTMQFSVADDAPNFIKQAYLHLKALPEWADATDC